MLVWVTPVVFVLAVIYLIAEVMILRATTQVTTAEVVHVYAWENDAPQIFYPGDMIYSPRYRYEWTDGTMTEATAGWSHTDWNFAIGSTHQIRFDPDVKDNVILAGPVEWWVARTVARIGAWTFLPALVASIVAWAWLRRGEQS